MTILIIADDELLSGKLAESKVDLIVSCGDLPDDVILRSAVKCNCSEILAVKGNHDSGAGFPQPIKDLHLRTIDFGGLLFGGFCGSWKYKPKGHYLFDEVEVETALKSFPRVDVFVAHNSPRLVHDRDDDVHYGFTAFSNYISRTQPAFFLHGHQHVNRESTLSRTRVIGTYGHRFLTIPN
jgi:Icc-related predicted phosphoesterase